MLNEFSWLKMMIDDEKGRTKGDAPCRMYPFNDRWWTVGDLCLCKGESVTRRIVGMHCDEHYDDYEFEVKLIHALNRNIEDRTIDEMFVDTINCEVVTLDDLISTLDRIASLLRSM